jgi:hypothetical protein
MLAALLFTEAADTSSLRTVRPGCKVTAVRFGSGGPPPIGRKKPVMSFRPFLGSMTDWSAQILMLRPTLPPVPLSIDIVSVMLSSVTLRPLFARVVNTAGMPRSPGKRAEPDARMLRSIRFDVKAIVSMKWFHGSAPKLPPE